MPGSACRSALSWVKAAQADALRHLQPAMACLCIAHTSQSRGALACREAHVGPGAFDFAEWLPPDFKAHYAPLGRGLASSLASFPGAQQKPLLIVHNKVSSSRCGSCQALPSPSSS